MQKYNQKIGLLFEKIDRLSNDISIILEKNEISDKDLIQIADIYFNKATLVEKLNTFYNSTEGEELLADNKDFWNKNIDKLMEIDQKNLKKLELIKNEKGEKLRTIMKQKSVLIYNR